LATDKAAYEKLEAAYYDLDASGKTAAKAAKDAADKLMKESEAAFEKIDTELAPFKKEWERRENERKEKEDAASKK